MDEPVSSSQISPSSDPVFDAPTDCGVPSSNDTGSADEMDAATVTPSTGNPHLGAACGVAPLPGQCIGDYELIREIARGGMGVVYLAKQPLLNRMVAIKMVLDGASASESELQRFANEARAAAALDHPGIVPVYEVGTHDECPFFSMAYVDGTSVANLLAKGPLEPHRAAEIAKDVALAIVHAHQHQIIHRDLKPANILIDRDGAPKVTDFGVCKSLSSHSHLTSSGELIGTPHYMPPEQAGTPDAEIGPQSDVYSIGAVLYAMLAARPPFQAPSPIDVVAQVMTKDPVPPSKLVSGIPDDLETIAMKCLAKSPKERYQTASLLADDLQRFLADEPILAKPPGIIKRVHHNIRRHIFLASVSGSLAITLVVFSILLGLALLQSRAQVLQLRELLKIERIGARRLVNRSPTETVTLIEYDVRRLTDAAIRFADEDRQLAMNLSVYAAQLAVKHGVTPPDKLRELMSRFAGTGVPPKPNDQASDARLSDLIQSTEKQINRELTEFEIAVYGLYDPSHEMEPQNSRANPKESE